MAELKKTEVRRQKKEEKTLPLAAFFRDLTPPNPSLLRGGE
jgi:hypothetical protein